jgi:hypothetical protein
MSPAHKRALLLLLENRIGAERELGFASAIANAAALESVRDSFINDQEELEYLRDRVADLGALAD